MKWLWTPWRMEFVKSFSKSSACIFCSVFKEETDRENLILHRSSSCFTILNRYPYTCGHLMVVPRQHTHQLTDLSDEALLDIHRSVRAGLVALEEAIHPHGFNVGMNIGEAGGAGIPDHLHYHVVPRWNGDTSFMALFGETRVLPETLDQTYDRLKPHFA